MGWDLLGWLNPSKADIESRYQSNPNNNGRDPILGAMDDALDSYDSISGPIRKNLLDPLPIDNSLGQPVYDFTQRIFPSDLGSGVSYNGHYVVINISVQQATTYTKISGRGRTDQLSTILSNASPSNPNGSPTQLSKTDALRYFIDNQFSGTVGKPLGITQDGLTRPRYTRRIQESIALYMPNSEMTFTDAHGYDDISLTKFAAAGAGLVLGAAATAAGSLFGAPGAAVANKGADIIGSAASGLAGLAQLGGTPINPKVEILFANTFQREFSFDFLLAPSSLEESEALQQIIRTLRFHAAPERRAGFVESFFWIPPSEFDITFYNRGVENTNIPRINTCVLKQIDVSYAPTGVYSTFSNGHPVQVRMVLRFAETSVVDKLKILEGF